MPINVERRERVVGTGQMWLIWHEIAGDDERHEECRITSPAVNVSTEVVASTNLAPPENRLAAVRDQARRQGHELRRQRRGVKPVDRVLLARYDAADVDMAITIETNQPEVGIHDNCPVERQ